MSAPTSPATLVAREKPSPSARWVILTLSAVVVLLSVVLSIGSDGEQVIVPLVKHPLPPTCTLKKYTGLDCPGCGLTRSFISVGHGQFAKALAFNPAGPLWFVLIAGQIPWQAWQLRRISHGKQEIDLGWWGQGLLYAGMAALIIQWVVRQL